jgi:regulator of sigma E protease
MQASETSISTISVRRAEEVVVLELKMPSEKFLEEFMTIPPRFRSPYILGAEGSIYAASIEKSKMNWDMSLDLIGSHHLNKSLYIWKVDLKKGQSENPKVVGEPTEVDLGEFNSSKEFYAELARQGYYPLDLQIQSIVMDSPADKVGLQAKDILIDLNGVALLGFEDLRQKLQGIPDKKSVQLSVIRSGKTMAIELVPNVSYNEGKSVKTIGVYGGGLFLPVKYVQSPSIGIFASFSIALEKTIDSIEKTFIGYKRLFLNEVSPKNIGGPIAIAKVAADSFNISLSYFFKLMALISVNLGIINLFPIPVLDGGHIMFIFFEIINRGPLSRRKMEIAQQFGASLLFLLIFAALYNDISRLF